MNTYCNHETSYKAAHRFIPTAVFETNVSERYLKFYFLLKINIFNLYMLTVSAVVVKKNRGYTISIPSSGIMS